MILLPIKSTCLALATLLGSLTPLQPATAAQPTCVNLGGYRICIGAPVTRPAVPQPTPQVPTKPAPKPPAQPAPKQPVQPAPQPPATETSVSSGLTAQEQQMLNLINAERAKAGLAPLKADPKLTQLARLKSQDMIARGYFSHYSPTYGSPFDMMKRFGVTYRTAGENIAGNRSVEAAHAALMNSPGHRANILNPNFTKVGIGIVSGGPYGMMITQMFTG